MLLIHTCVCLHTYKVKVRYVLACNPFLIFKIKNLSVWHQVFSRSSAREWCEHCSSSRQHLWCSFDASLVHERGGFLCAFHVVLRWPPYMVILFCSFSFLHLGSSEVSTEIPSADIQSERKEKKTKDEKVVMVPLTATVACWCVCVWRMHQFAN